MRTPLNFYYGKGREVSLYVIHLELRANIHTRHGPPLLLGRGAAPEPVRDLDGIFTRLAAVMRNYHYATRYYLRAEVLP